MIVYTQSAVIVCLPSQSEEEKYKADRMSPCVSLCLLCGENEHTATEELAQQRMP